MTAEVVLTDYVWDSLDVERRTLEGLATLVPLQTKTPDQFLPEAEADTRGMMNDGAFAQMRPRAVLINCSRGPVVDTAALVRALDAGRLAGCALDTTDPEPLPDPHPLRGRENVIVTPHAAWYSEQAMVGLQAGAPDEVRRVLTGQWPVNVVNPAVKGKTRAGL